MTRRCICICNFAQNGWLNVFHRNNQEFWTVVRYYKKNLFVTYFILWSISWSYINSGWNENNEIAIISCESVKTINNFLVNILKIIVQWYNVRSWASTLKCTRSDVLHTNEVPVAGALPGWRSRRSLKRKGKKRMLEIRGSPPLFTLCACSRAVFHGFDPLNSPAEKVAHSFGLF